MLWCLGGIVYVVSGGWGVCSIDSCGGSMHYTQVCAPHFNVCTA